MCFQSNANASSDLSDLFSEVDVVLASLKFIFIANGIVLPSIVSLGIVLNVSCLVVLCRKSLRSAPYCLLQCLTVCDVLIMLFSIYSDIVPAIRANADMNKFSKAVNLDCQLVKQMKLKLQTLDMSNYTGDGTQVSELNFPTHMRNSNRSADRSEEKNRAVQQQNGDYEDQLLLLLLHQLLLKDSNKNIDQQSKTSKFFSSESPLQNLADDHSKHDTNVENNVNIKHKNSRDVSPSFEAVAVNSSKFQSNISNTTSELTPTLEDMSSKQLERSKMHISESVHEDHWSLKMFSVEYTTSSMHGNKNKTTGNPEVPVNTRPLAQAVERWFAYSLMTFNLGVTFILAAERCLAVRSPFRARTLLTPRRTYMTAFGLTVLTFLIHTPQFLKEVYLFLTSPEKLRDDFQGSMLQSFREVHERFLTYFTSVLLLGVLGLNVALVNALMDYRSKVKRNIQPGNKKSVDVNITVAIVVLVFLQLPHNMAMNVVATLSMEGFRTNVLAFTRAVVIIRVLYIANSAFNCITYCFLSRRFRFHFLSTYACLHRSCFRKWYRSNAAEVRRYQREPPTCTTSSGARGSMTSLNKDRISPALLKKSQSSLNSVTLQIDRPPL